MPTPPGFPQEAQRLVLESAERDGRPAVEGSVVLVRWNDVEVPQLLWLAEGDGGICKAQSYGDAGYSVGCAKESDIIAAPSPGLQMIISSSLNDRMNSWNGVLLASDETLEEISCGPQHFPTHKVLTTRIGGVIRTVYSVTYPWGLGGSYRATVERAGQQMPDTVQVLAEGQAQC
ncbi:hypothetical protein OG689_04690 [Kitasatospora sp. NBC_00240]|uniref:hypothetical protein n=1 Tax=Kitasatospora sp. NBC_00240 TaxID=2903567 RepID=UPI00225A555B|nr:hypothetical protein [Kitasatospora sp. NBC_00240]MCX5208598.1 hypothetical protein [Kitasatospora sp. NBC_00240]